MGKLLPGKTVETKPDSIFALAPAQLHLGIRGDDHSFQMLDRDREGDKDRLYVPYRLDGSCRLERQSQQESFSRCERKLNRDGWREDEGI